MINTENTKTGNWYKDRFIFSESKIGTKCDICGKLFYLPKSKTNNYKRCGSECSKRFREYEKAKRLSICFVCGDVFYPRAIQVRLGMGKVCSQKCNGVIHTGEGSTSWRGGEKETKKRYKESHPGYWKIHCQNRKARKRKNGGVLSKGLYEKLYKVQRGKCACCRIELLKNAHMDHIMPLSKGGLHFDLNIQLLCASCNHQKSAKHPIDFMQSKGYLL